ncbi:hypothetical protein [Pelagibius sp. Alg239-R121]|uniref:hypothetical protein n=1 Tax=Pelagibius sp. Alg239-R121 TaxID=2993448 RepID=UPI0024A67663|nr:hypothetical protein [Pelagibius sp. Alg239-R121]
MTDEKITALRERLVLSRRNQVNWLAGRPLDECMSPAAVAGIVDAHIALLAIDAVLQEDIADE